MTARFSPAVRLRRRLMRANFGEIIQHCHSVVGWRPDDTADILIAVGGDKARFSAAIDKWLRLDNRPGASAPNGAASLLKFITEGGLIVDDVRHRLVESMHARLIDAAAPLGIFTRETIVEGLVLCDGSIDRFNDCYNAWRKLNPTLTAPTARYETAFLDYVRGTV